MHGFPASWWVMGGWGIDLFLGRETRPHDDVDILVFRENQSVIRRHFFGWDLWVSDASGGLSPWCDGEELLPPIYEIYLRRSPQDSWEFQIVLMDREGAEWTYRGDPQLRGPVSELGMISASSVSSANGSAGGIPCLRPEVLLFLKSRSIRDKDTIDFNNVLPHLSPQSRVCLQAYLRRLSNPAHPWLKALES